MVDERMLISAAKGGDREAFSGLVRLHQARLRALVALSLSERDDVLDVVQESFVDAWRGGPRRGLRGPDFDLGCLFLDGATSFKRDEQALFFAAYRAESLRRGRPLDARWPARIERARAAVHRRERGRRPGLAPTWEFPAGA